MTEAFNVQRLSKGLATRALGCFLTGSAQTTYTNVVNPVTHDPTRLPVTWPLIVHSLLSRFVADDLLRNEYYAVTSARIKQSENEMDFAERVHDMARRCRNVFFNAELANCFKQVLTDATRLILEKNLRGLPTSTRDDLDCVKQYAVTTGTAPRACQALSVSTSTLSTPRQRTQKVYHVPDNLWIASFPTSPTTLLSASVRQTPHVVDPTKLPRLQVPDDRMA